MHQPTQKTTFKRYDTPLQDGNRGAEFYQETVFYGTEMGTGVEFVIDSVPNALWGVTKESLIKGMKDNITRLNEEHTKAVAEVQAQIDEITLL